MFPFQEHRKDLGPVPLLIKIYGGPGSQRVSRSRTPYEEIVEEHGIAVAYVDPVGTGYQGMEKMFRCEQKMLQRLSSSGSIAT